VSNLQLTSNGANTNPRMHEDSLPWPCQYCRHRSFNKAELERHVYAWHHGHVSWSCANLTSWQAAFHGSEADRSSDLCGYCGKIFQKGGPGVLTRQDWLNRIAHLHRSHKFECCDRAERFIDITHFREHFRTRHDAIIGEWTEKLVDACVANEVISEESYQKSQYNEAVKTILREEAIPGAASEAWFGTIDVKDHMLDKYGAVLVGADPPGSPRELVLYVRLLRIVERKQSNERLLEVFLRKIERSSKFAVQEITKAKNSIERGLVVLKADLERARQACWLEGFDLDFVGDFIPSREAAGEKHEAGCENLAVMWSEVLNGPGDQTGSTKRGRINCWLLQNLIASPEESTRHRSYLQNGQNLGGGLWAQLVLDFWLIDEAAIGVESRSSSTNGAVDSDGLCNSDRVHLEVLPLRKRRELDSDENSSENLEPRKKVKF
jgi:hypothetical protein